MPERPPAERWTPPTSSKRPCKTGGVRFIGSTTHREYRAQLEKDRAFVRRFQKIDISEPEPEAAVKILEGLRRRYETHHKVRYTKQPCAGRWSSPRASSMTAACPTKQWM